MDEANGSDVVMLSGIREGVPVLWHEAVAVVSGLAAWVAEAGPTGRVPDFNHVGFSRTGEVIVFPGGPAGSDPARGLASLLLEMLGDGSAPPPLVDMANSAAAGAGGHSVESFIRELRFYERPNPAHDVQTLAARIDSHLRTLTADRQLAALQQRVQQEQRKSPQEKPKAPERPTSAPDRRWLLPSIAALALALLAGGAYYVRADLAKLGTWLQPSHVPEASPEESRAQSPQRRRPAASSRTDASSPPSPGAGPGSAPASSSAAQSAGGDLPAGALGGGVTAGDEVGSATLDFAVVDPGNPGNGAAASSDPRVYTRADAGVSPPSLVQPRLPSEPPPGVPDDQIGEIELVINEAGRVERVRLVSPANRFSERMLLSAVKAWVFEPATKDGRPVKYLTRVRVTI